MDMLTCTRILERRHQYEEEYTAWLERLAEDPEAYETEEYEAWMDKWSR